MEERLCVQLRFPQDASWTQQNPEEGEQKEQKEAQSGKPVRNLWIYYDLRHRDESTFWLIKLKGDSVNIGSSVYISAIFDA